MAIDDDLSSLLPPSPPPRPARRDATIDAALRRFDGSPDVAAPAPLAPRPGRLRRPQAGLLTSAVIVAVIGVPATLIMLRDQPVAPVRSTPPEAPATTALQQAPVAEQTSSNAASDEVAGDAAAPRADRSAPGALAESVPSNSPTKPAPRATIRDQGESVGAMAALPVAAAPPPPPPPPPPAPIQAVQAPAAPREMVGRAVDEAAISDIVVTGSRVQSNDEMSDDRPAFARRERAKQSAAPSNATVAGKADSVAGLLGRALAYQREGKFDAALADLDRAHRIAPSDRRVLRLRAAIHRQLGDRRRAERDERRVRELDAE